MIVLIIYAVYSFRQNNYISLEGLTIYSYMHVRLSVYSENSVFVYRLIGATLIGIFLMIPSYNRIEISVKGDTCVLLSVKGLTRINKVLRCIDIFILHIFSIKKK